MIRYVLHPGFVRSDEDGRRHYIAASHLARLYGVLMAECVLMPAPDSPQARGFNEPPNAVHLHPRRDGNYDLAAACSACDTAGISGQPNER